LSKKTGKSIEVGANKDLSFQMDEISSTQYYFDELTI